MTITDNVTVLVHIEHKFSRVDPAQLMNNFKKDWAEFVETEGVNLENIFSYEIDKFITGIINIYGVEDVLGNESWNQITEIEVEE